MSRKWFLYLIAGIVALTFIGCIGVGQMETPIINDTSSMASETVSDASIKSDAASSTGDTRPTASQLVNDAHGKEEDYQMSICQMFINGKDVSGQHYARIDADRKMCELSVLGISAELGAEIQWVGFNVVEISYMGAAVLIDTQKEEFGIPLPPGAVGSVRKVIDEEIIVDYISIKGLFENMMEAKISVDYDAGTVYINSMTE